MNVWKPFVNLMLIFLLSGVVACGVDSPENETPSPPIETCTNGKCDDPNTPIEIFPMDVLANLELAIKDSNPDDGTEIVKVFGGVLPEALAELYDSHELSLRIYGSDGAAGEYALESSMTLDKYRTGMYFSEEFEIDFLPWQQLTIEVSGEFDGKPISETFIFNRSACDFYAGELSCQGIRPGQDPVTPQNPFPILEMEILDFDPDAGNELVQFKAFLIDGLRHLVSDGDGVALSIRQSDGAGGLYQVQTMLVFDEDQDLFLSDYFLIDFLPWQQLTLIVEGQIGDREIEQFYTITLVSDCSQQADSTICRAQAADPTD